MSERLQKVIAHAGLSSRRGAEELILTGQVVVNGQVVTELGTKVDPERDHIEVSGKKLRTTGTKPRIVYALHKPKSVVTTLHDPEGRDTVVNYFPKIKERLFPVGRLDYDAEGLLLITNDGDLANRLIHPSSHVWKEYLVKLRGKIPLGLLPKMEKGPTFEGKKHQPVKIKFLHYKNEKSWLSVSLQEGVKHHLKKMFLAEGFRVEKIKRYRIGNIELLELQAGEFRRLEDEEINQLLSLSQEP
ncbi:MAG: pseudouridine synthase [Candidatus Lambdaproteobacteria bacterium RIFOXYD1_FULL_56_27]|uniref:Pseudouridine synthase n=1 Tax=Candidatus Lambdaproteobacteria bacterium RIFOXYD2_FULL_56_26 TaxID=1817773 RepID=A0A1F6GQK7_9PROT|nr:MAG: pseudouridine synthase [Candidatus Lambdaproteobacteria bacterium RIFOXYD2_FULL_56_26]OGH04158.1 MAG: pseudouridine synthase [Candidatus Lambdaproteobacteria bacterium RIFOXYC1_FULL_56_13]OGH06325.1 MAG: pseudouridine synthase [Candidatus Lambdaproteobacteria bacterium RIFOXYD1_FULL_56_27]